VKHYIALIHKEADSAFGVSFPDVPGVIASADTLDTALTEAREVLAFAAEDWAKLTGRPFPSARTLDAIRADPSLADALRDGVLAAIPLEMEIGAAA
jgi:predicted RNase H-like HicB family nuclease